MLKLGVFFCVFTPALLKRFVIVVKLFRKFALLPLAYWNIFNFFSPSLRISQKQKQSSQVKVVVNPPSPDLCNTLRVQRINEIRRHSSHSPSLTTKEYSVEKDRRHSGVSPNQLGIDTEHMRFLNCSPAASRRISCGSLFKPNEALGLSKSSLFADSSLNFVFDRRLTETADKIKSDAMNVNEKGDKTKRLPIINPLVRLPSWPSKYSIKKKIFSN